MTEALPFTMAYYFRTLTRILAEPRRFFLELKETNGFRKPIAFLVVSSVIFTLASMIVATPSEPLKAIVIYLVNAMGMSFITMVLGYLTMVTIFGKRVSFSRLFTIYSLASGVTLLVSWVPYFIWFTEPWKWWIIGSGFVNACGFRWYQALVIIAVTLFIMISSFLALFSTFF